jgi:transcriptional regulator GlxA family with amidase domain
MNHRLLVSPKIYQRLSRVKEFMDDNYELPLDLDQLAQQACFSRFHFLRLFREVFHVTPHQYLMRTRIDRAKELLATGRQSVTDVCFEVGFQSHGSFSTLFRRYVGHPPISYRSMVFLFRTVSSPPGSLIPACFLTMFEPRTRLS